MNKLRPKRFKNMQVDMSALCDVTFLLLCFFVVTAQFQQWEPMKENIPAAHKRIIDLPGDNLAIIYVSGNKVMFQVEGDPIRSLALTQMCEIYHTSFSPDEREKFVNSPIIGSPICNLKNYDESYMDWTHQIDRPGIPYNSTDSELFHWIKESRIADRALNGKDLRICIKADQGVEYPVIKQVIAILQKQKVNKFSLLTDSKNDKAYLE